MTATEIKKVVCPGSGKSGRVFVEIYYRDGKLSLCGVEGPRPNGDARGSCGQCHPVEVTEFYEGWNAEFLARLNEIWERWHLNDMRAGCEHQRAAGWGREEIEVVTYKLTREGHRLREQAEKEANAAARAGRVADLTATGRALLSDEWFRTRYSAPDADSPLSGLFEVEKREKKQSGWVREDEHPRGELCKPCPTCGYKYGSAWLREEVPADVIEWLAALPESEVVYPWTMRD